MTLRRGILFENQCFWNCQNCHCNQTVTLTGVTAIDQVCNMHPVQPTLFSARKVMAKEPRMRSPMRTRKAPSLRTCDSMSSACSRLMLGWNQGLPSCCVQRVLAHSQILCLKPNNDKFNQNPVAYYLFGFDPNRTNLTSERTH